MKKFIYFVFLLSFLVGSYPVFAYVMKSNNYRLELEPGEISPIEGIRERGLEETTMGSTHFLKDLKAEFLSGSEFNSGKVILFIVILLFLLLYLPIIIIRNYSLARKKQKVGFNNKQNNTINNV